MMQYLVQAVCLNELVSLGTIELGSSDPNARIIMDLLECEYILDKNVLLAISVRRKVILVSTNEDEPILILRRNDVQIQ